MRFYRFILLGYLFIGLHLTSCSVREAPTPEPPQYKEAMPNKLTLEPVTFAQLPGWDDDRISDALPALSLSCQKILARPDEKPMGKTRLGGTVKDWRTACTTLLAARGRVSEKQARRYIATHFIPHKVGINNSNEGTFTGYYEAAIEASYHKSRKYNVPIYMPPVKLKEQAGSAMMTRTAIEEGALDGKGYALMWADDPVDVFMLHIQGSGVAQMTDGQMVRLSYADNNGHKFKSIMPALKDIGYDIKEYGATMDAIGDWLRKHPKKARKVMASNPRYIFFKTHNKSGPIGAQGVPLTPTRSLAVDPSYIPLGMPLWLSTRFPATKSEKRVINRFVVAQDTGAAIKGGVRGDFFWGYGRNASWAAGRMKEKGTYFVFLPKTIAGRKEQGKTIY